MMKMLKGIIPHLQDELVIKVKYFVIICVWFLSCQGNNVTDAKAKHVQNLIRYLKNNSVDSTVLTQPFFNEQFKEKNNPYNSYIIGLQQMKVYLQNRDVKVSVDNKNSDIYVLFTNEDNNSNRIFLLVRNDGIESFSPLFKGKEIVGWM